MLGCMASNADTPRARALGAELREARQRAGLSQGALADVIGRSKSHVSRWENGRLIPSETDTAQVLQALGVRGAERARLLELARDALDPDWLAPGIDRQAAALAEYERTARTIINVEPLMIPGLMQTYDYASHVSFGHGVTRGEAQQRAQLRVGRQHVLTRTPPIQLVAIVGEYAVRNAPCPRSVMVDQLRHLLKLAAMENVTLQLLPMKTASVAVLTGPWALIEFDRTKPIVHLEHYASSATITDAKSVARYRSAVDTLREEAMSPTDSLGLIADIIEHEEITL